MKKLQNDLNLTGLNKLKLATVLAWVMQVWVFLKSRYFNLSNREYFQSAKVLGNMKLKLFYVDTLDY